MQSITATLVNLYHVCKRELYLHAHEIRMEQTSDIVTEGRLIGENTYLDRAEKYTQLELEGIKIDYYDPHSKIVHEVKKSNRMEYAHEAQVKYYLYKLRQYGIEGATGILEYPALRKRTDVALTDKDITEIKDWEEDIKEILASDIIPPVINKASCRKCSYYEFCYV